jgi:alpha-mannosidase
MKRKQARSRKRSSYAWAAVACALAACTAVAHAQREQEQELQQALTNLPASAQTTIERLGQLNQFQADDWHYHIGDLPHGEDAELNDASWQVVKPGTEAPAGAVWYRRVIEVPKTFHGYDSTGTKIWFRFQVRSEGDAPQIIYLDGRRIALGADLEPIVLTNNAKPGERFLIAVKLLPTAGPKTFEGAEFRVDYAANRPSPNDLRMQFLSANILIPTLSKDPKADMATLEKAIGEVDLADLGSATKADEAKFDASLRRAQAALEPLKPMLQQATFHETGNSHIDAAWLWPRSETIDVVRRTFGTAAQLLQEYPKYTYTQSAAQYNEWMQDKYPELNDEIKKDIKAGRWEVVGGMWVEPDLNLPGGESTVRSILLGKRWYEKNYGVDVTIGWNPDSFGYNWQLPQMYARSGITTFVTQKMSWNDTNQLPFKLFWWESPDGSKVLTYFPHGYGNTSLDPLRLSIDMAAARKDSPGLTEMMDLYGVSDHGGGPTRAMLDQGMHWSDGDYAAPKMKFGTAGTFFSAVEPKIAPDSKTWDYKTIAQGYTYPATPADGQIDIPTWDDELYLEFHRGVYTSQAAQKYNLRHSEVEALDAEKYASLAWLHGNSYPNAELTDAWEKITFNDFHDLAAGSGIAVIYRDAAKDFATVTRETDEISQGAQKTLDARVDTAGGPGVPVLVWNPLGWERSGPVTVTVQMPQAAESVSVVDGAGKVLPSEVLHSDADTHSFTLQVEAEHVPAMGYTVLHVVPGKKEFKSDLKADGLTLENADLRLTVDPTNGCITSLYDKRDNFETLAKGGCGNQLQAFVNNPKEYDAWNINPDAFKKPMDIDEVDSVKLIDDNPMRGVIRIQRHWQGSTFTQDISLAAGADHAVVSTNVEWHEKHIFLKAAFPLAATSPEATFEIPYGSIQRPTTRNNSFEQAKFEVPALRWADEGDAEHGFSLINDSKYGYDVIGNLLRLSVLRSPTSPDPNTDQGHQHFQYELYPHAGGWKQALTVQHGYNFNYPLQAEQVEAHTGQLPASHSYASIEDAPNVVLTAMKKAEDSDALILRMYEYAGKETQLKVKLPAGATEAMETNLMEQKDGPALPLAGGVASVTIHPFEILTLKVNYKH